MTDDLEPIDPHDAVEWYLEDKRDEYSDSTVEAQSYRLAIFADWLVDERDIENLNEITGRDLMRYKTWRGQDLAKASLKGQLATVRVFLRWSSQIDAVPERLYEKVQLPTMGKSEGSRDVMVDGDEARQIRAYLSEFRYASLWHTYVELLLSGLRVGSIHSLDIPDYDPEEQSLQVVHRPETGTTLKNGEEAERKIAITDKAATVIDDWLAHQRPDVEDNYGRKPLLATKQGRAAKQTLRTISYKITRPCFYSTECPEGRDIESCEATVHGGENANKCPSSKSPHPWRRGTITRMLRETDAPDRAVSGRFDVAPDVIDKHYDRRSEEEKMESRRKWAEDLDEE